MSWNIGKNRKHRSQGIIKIGTLTSCAHKTQKLSQKNSLTPMEKQQLPDMEKTNSNSEFSCLKWRKYNGRRKVCVIYQTDTDELNIFVLCYLYISIYRKGSEMELKMTE